MKKLGLDIHGVIDDNPEFFSELSKKLIEDGNEVHIITGAPQSKDVVQKLLDMKIEYTHFFSIVDWAESIGVNVEWTDNGPMMDEHTWDIAKSIYCSQNGIDIHVDDTPRYGEYFKHISTRFVKYEWNNMSMPTIIRQVVASAGECDNYPCNKQCPQYIMYRDRMIETTMDVLCGDKYGFRIDRPDLAEYIVDEILNNMI